MKIRTASETAAKSVPQFSRLVSEFDGSKLQANAAMMVAAIEKVGGTTRLTASEQAKANAVLQQYIDKAAAMGVTVPAHFQKLADATRKSSDETIVASKATSVLTSGLAQMAAAFSIGALINSAASSIKQFASDIVAGAGALIDMSHKTGLSTDTLERFAYVGKAAGVTVETLADAAFKLGVNLSKGGAGVVGALQDLGLSLADIKAMSPDQQFDAIAAALEGMVDPQERNRIGMELFGKQFKEIVPAIVEGYTRLKDEAITSGRAQLDAIDAAADAWDLFVQKSKTTVTAAAGTWVMLGEKALSSVGGYLEVAKALWTLDADMLNAIISGQALTKGYGEQGKAAKDAAADTEDYDASLVAAKADVEALTAAQLTSIGAALALGRNAEDVRKVFNLSADAMKMATDQLKDNAAVATANAKHISALAEAQAQAQIKAQERVDEITRRSIKETGLIWADTYAMQGEMGNTRLRGEQKRVEDEFNMKVGMLNRLDSNYAAHYAALRAKADTSLQALLVDNQVLHDNSRLTLEDKAAIADATYEAMLASSGEFSIGTIQHFREIAFQARQSARNWRDAWDTASTGAAQGAKGHAAAWNDAGKDIARSGEKHAESWSSAFERAGNKTVEKAKEVAELVRTYTEQMIAQVSDVPVLSDTQAERMGGRAGVERRISAIEAYYKSFPGAAEGGTGTTGVTDQAGWNTILEMRVEYQSLKNWLKAHSRAMGGPVSSGVPYLIGERGPEIFLPRQAGTIVPNHALGSSGGMAVNITINGSVLGSRHAIARVVGDAVLKSARQAGMRLTGRA